MSFTKKQAIEAKYWLCRAGECALLSFHSDEDEWIGQYWLNEADDAFKKAATALGYLVEPVTDNEIAAGKPEACPLSEAEEGGALPPSTHPGLGASS